MAMTIYRSIDQVLVHEGELIMGNVDKKTVGSGAQGLIHISWLEKGWDVTRLFMNMVNFSSRFPVISDTVLASFFRGSPCWWHVS